MHFTNKSLNSNMLYLIKRYNPLKKKRTIIKTFIWTKIIGWLNNKIFFGICRKKKRLIRANQASIGYSIYYQLYHNKNATFRAKVEKKKQLKREKELKKEQQKKLRKDAWKTKVINVNKNVEIKPKKSLYKNLINTILQ